MIVPAPGANRAKPRCRRVANAEALVVETSSHPTSFPFKVYQSSAICRAGFALGFAFFARMQFLLRRPICPLCQLPYVLVSSLRLTLRITTPLTSLNGKGSSQRRRHESSASEAFDG